MGFLEETCWLWTNARTKGYGSMFYLGKLRQAHRVVYEIYRGPIPVGLQLDHTCRQRGCVNPSHLRAVTCRENLLAPGSKAHAARQAATTHCPSGHPYDPPETYSGTRRHCRTCSRLYQERRKQARA